MAEGVDFSFSRVSGAALRAAGKSFVVRYLWHNTAGSKGISRAEYDDFVRHGIAVAFVYEEDGAELTAGFAGGQRVARAAQACLNTLGLPNSVVYFVVDHNYSGGQLAAAIDGLRGAASVLGKARTGFYGGAPHIRAAMAAGACAYFWQTYAWSGGQIVPGIHLYQYNNGVNVGGGTVDLCRSYQASFGQVGSVFAGGGAITLEDDDMPTMNEFLNTPAYTGGPTISQVLKESHNVYAGVYGGGPSIPGGTSIVKLIDNIPARVWATTVSRGGKKVSALQELADAKTVALQLEVENAALKQAIAAISVASGVIDPAQIEAAAKAGAAEALKDLTLKAQ